MHKRDPIYAQDNTSSLESVKEFLKKHANVNRFALFQCTSIFLKNQYIKEALNRFITKDCVFAVTRYSHAKHFAHIHTYVCTFAFRSKPIV